MLYTAKVINNRSENFDYRIQVRIDNIHKYIEDKDLPWAARLDTSCLGASDGMIFHVVPEVGSTVLVLAIQDNLSSLVYLGTISNNNNLVPRGEDYFNSFGFYTTDNKKNWVWNKDGTMRLGPENSVFKILNDISANYNMHNHLPLGISPPTAPIVIKGI